MRSEKKCRRAHGAAAHPGDQWIVHLIVQTSAVFYSAELISVEHKALGLSGDTFIQVS